MKNNRKQSDNYINCLDDIGFRFVVCIFKNAGKTNQIRKKYSKYAI